MIIFSFGFVGHKYLTEHTCRSSKYENHQLQLELVFATKAVPLTLRYCLTFLSILQALYI